MLRFDADAVYHKPATETSHASYFTSSDQTVDDDGR